MSKDYEGARRRFQEAVAGQTKLFGAGSIRTAQGEYNVGLAELALGKHTDALAQSSQARRIWREALEPARVRRVSLAAVTMTAAEREALRFARGDRDGLLLAIDLAATGKLDGAAVARVWDAVIRDRAAVLDGMARRRHAAQAGGAAAGLMERILLLKKELAQAALVGDPKIYHSRVAELRQRLDGAEREMARQSLQFAREELGSRAGWREVMAAVPAGTALVGYARGAGNYVAFVGVAGQAEARAVSLGSLARVDGLVNAWQREVEQERSSAGRNARRNEESYRAAGATLRQAIWDPVARVVGNAKTVFAVPDGALQLLNLDTLPVGSTAYLAEAGPQFHVVPAERDLVVPATPGGGRSGTLLAVGNPAFGCGGPCGERA